MGKSKDPDIIAFFISKIHHRNPSARRLIHQELEAFGPEAVKPLAAVFSSGNVDEKIFAANIRFAIYDALGRTAGMTGLVYLVNALEETDQMVLMAVSHPLTCISTNGSSIR